MEDARQLLDLFPADLPGEVFRPLLSRSEVEVHVALDGASAYAEEVAFDPRPCQRHDEGGAVRDEVPARGPGLLPLLLL
ncbi:hypothetical protein [Streptomyces sp. MBT33]|uniref:hypothetical protein n=1 Tax=Streptomyces sp. MBT33 TaxID=1488363 RepID=UPI001F40DEB8|nr:hypothetical protein [Streptomyces sp. MBT33]